jgi:hypothetical protein
VRAPRGLVRRILHLPRRRGVTRRRGCLHANRLAAGPSSSTRAGWRSACDAAGDPSPVAATPCEPAYAGSASSPGAMAHRERLLMTGDGDGSSTVTGGPSGTIAAPGSPPARRPRSRNESPTTSGARLSGTWSALGSRARPP